AAGDDVDHAVRQYLGDDLTQHERREGRLWRGLQHQRVACREYRTQAARREQERVVEREDASYDAVRLPPRVVQVLGGRRHGRALHLERQPRVVLDGTGRAQHVFAHRIDWVAAIEGIEVGELLDALPD